MDKDKDKINLIKQDIESLDRVLNRLVLTKDDKLEGILGKLLPKIIDMFVTCAYDKVLDAQLRNKIIEVCGYINKRILSDTTIQLPCAELLRIINTPPTKDSPSSIVFARNFALVYFETGIKRIDQRIEILKGKDIYLNESNSNNRNTKVGSSRSISVEDEEGKGFDETLEQKRKEEIEKVNADLLSNIYLPLCYNLRLSEEMSSLQENLLFAILACLPSIPITMHPPPVFLLSKEQLTVAYQSQLVVTSFFLDIFLLDNVGLLVHKSPSSSSATTSTHDNNSDSSSNNSSNSNSKNSQKGNDLLMALPPSGMNIQQLRRLDRGGNKLWIHVGKGTNQVGGLRSNQSSSSANINQSGGLTSTQRLNLTKLSILNIIKSDLWINKKLFIPILLVAANDVESRISSKAKDILSWIKNKIFIQEQREQQEYERRQRLLRLQETMQTEETRSIVRLQSNGRVEDVGVGLDENEDDENMYNDEFDNISGENSNNDDENIAIEEEEPVEKDSQSQLTSDTTKVLNQNKEEQERNHLNIQISLKEKSAITLELLALCLDPKYAKEVFRNFIMEGNSNLEKLRNEKESRLQTSAKSFSSSEDNTLISTFQPIILLRAATRMPLPDSVIAYTLKWLCEECIDFLLVNEEITAQVILSLFSVSENSTLEQDTKGLPSDIGSRVSSSSTILSAAVSFCSKFVSRCSLSTLQKIASPVLFIIHYLLSLYKQTLVTIRGYSGSNNSAYSINLVKANELTKDECCSMISSMAHRFTSEVPPSLYSPTLITLLFHLLDSSFGNSTKELKEANTFFSSPHPNPNASQETDDGRSLAISEAIGAISVAYLRVRENRKNHLLSPSSNNTLPEKTRSGWTIKEENFILDTLIRMSFSSVVRCRTMAIEWISKMFPKTNILPYLLCLIRLEDVHSTVRKTAESGLVAINYSVFGNLFSKSLIASSYLSSTTTSSSGTSNNSKIDINERNTSSYMQIMEKLLQCKTGVIPYFPHLISILLEKTTPLDQDIVPPCETREINARLSNDQTNFLNVEETKEIYDLDFKKCFVYVELQDINLFHSEATTAYLIVLLYKSLFVYVGNSIYFSLAQNDEVHRPVSSTDESETKNKQAMDEKLLKQIKTLIDFTLQILLDVGKSSDKMKDDMTSRTVPLLYILSSSCLLNALLHLPAKYKVYIVECILQSPEQGEENKTSEKSSVINRLFSLLQNLYGPEWNIFISNVAHLIGYLIGNPLFQSMMKKINFECKEGEHSNQIEIIERNLITYITPILSKSVLPPGIIGSVSIAGWICHYREALAVNLLSIIVSTFLKAPTSDVRAAGREALIQVSTNKAKYSLIFPVPNIGSGSTSTYSLKQVLDALKDEMKSDSIKISINAVDCMVSLAQSNHKSADEQTNGKMMEREKDDNLHCVNTCLSGLISLAYRKESELQFAVGEGIASLLLFRAEMERHLSSKDNDKMEDDIESTYESADETFFAKLKFCSVEDVINFFISKTTKNFGATIRCSASIWLLIILKKCINLIRNNLTLLENLQFALLSLLGERNELTKEVAACGISTMYVLFNQSTDNIEEETDKNASLRAHLLSVMIAGLTNKKRSDVSNVVSTSETQGTVEDEENLEENRTSGNSNTSNSAVNGESRTDERRVRFQEGPSNQTQNPPVDSRRIEAPSSYKELCQLAIDIKRPDVLPYFLSMTLHHEAWSFSRALEYGPDPSVLEEIVVTILKPILFDLLPRIFPYRWHPNSQVKETMTKLWKALTLGLKAHAIDGGHQINVDSNNISQRLSQSTYDDEKDYLLGEHTKLMTSCLQGLNSLDWRVRICNLGALQHLLQNKSHSHVLPYLEKLWQQTFWALDDIVQQVQDVANNLASSLSTLSSRLCNINSVHDANLKKNATKKEDLGQEGITFSSGETSTQTKLSDVEETEIQNVQQTITIMVPLLLEKGLIQKCKEAMGISLATLIRIIKEAEGSTLSIYLPDILIVLHEALSGLEPSTLQYLQFHVNNESMGGRGGSNMDRDNQLESIRVSLASQSPVQGAIDECMKRLTPEIVSQVLSRFLQLLRTGVGLNTRCGAANFIVMIGVRYPDLLRKESSNFLQVLMHGCLNERSQTTKRAFLGALSTVARLANGSRVGKMIEKLIVSYKESADKAVEAGKKLPLASIMRQLVKSSAEHLPKSVFKKLLPLCFVCRFDNENIKNIYLNSNGDNASASLSENDKDENVEASTKEISQLMVEMWGEGLQYYGAGKGEMDIVNDLLFEMVEEIKFFLNCSSWSLRLQACIALQRLAQLLGTPIPKDDNGLVLTKQGSIKGGEKSKGNREIRFKGALVIDLIYLLINKCKGRIWEGKFVLLSTIVSLIICCGGSISDQFIKDSEILAEDNNDFGGDENTMLKEISSRQPNYLNSRDWILAGESTEEIFLPSVFPISENEEDLNDESILSTKANLSFESKLNEMLLVAQKEHNIKDETSTSSRIEPSCSFSSGSSEMMDREELDEKNIMCSLRGLAFFLASQCLRNNRDYRREALAALKSFLLKVNRFHFWKDLDSVLVVLSRIDISIFDPASKPDYVAQIRALDCLGLIFPSIPVTTIIDAPMASRKMIQSQREAFQLLFPYFVAPPHGSVWSIRAACYRSLSIVLGRAYIFIDDAEASRLASVEQVKGKMKGDKYSLESDTASSLESGSNENSVLTREAVLKSLVSIEAGVRDTKYSLIRVAALECLLALVERKEGRLRDMLLPLCDDYDSSTNSSQTKSPDQISIRGILQILAHEEEPRVNIVKERVVELLNKY